MSRQFIHIPTIILREIEHAVDAQSFQGSAIGITLNDTLINAFDMATKAWDWKSHLRNRIRRVYHRFCQPWKGTGSYEALQGRILCTWLFDRQDLKDFLLPLLSYYGPKGTFVVAPASQMRMKLPSSTDFLLWSDFPRIDMKEWRAAFSQCEPKWRAALQVVVVKHGLPGFITEFLLGHLELQTQRILSAGKFLDLARPRAIATEYDRNEHSSCLLIAARQRGIPSVTMVHSALNPFLAFGFTPILADAVCCWGERQRAILGQSGADSSRLFVTGCHALKRELKADAAVVKTRLGITAATPLILLATSPIKLQERKQYALAFCTALANVACAQALVRLHPAERLEEYADLIAQFPKIFFLANSEMSRDESLSAADVVFIHDSAFGSDALMKGKLVVVIDVLGTPLGVGQELADLAGCPVVRSVDAAAALVRELIANSGMRDSLYMKGKRYADQYCDSYGDEAALRVFGVIDRAIADSSAAAFCRPLPA